MEKCFKCGHIHADTGTAGCPNPPQTLLIHQGWDTDATNVLKMIGELQAEVTRLRTLVVEEYARGFKDGISAGGES